MDLVDFPEHEFERIEMRSVPRRNQKRAALKVVSKSESCQLQWLFLRCFRFRIHKLSRLTHIVGSSGETPSRLQVSVSSEWAHTTSAAGISRRI
jgi:hypothetical protein